MLTSKCSYLASTTLIYIIMIIILLLSNYVFSSVQQGIATGRAQFLQVVARAGQFASE